MSVTNGGLRHFYSMEWEPDHEHTVKVATKTSPAVRKFWSRHSIISPGQYKLRKIATK